MRSAGIGEVVESKNDKYPVACWVSGMTGVQDQLEKNTDEAIAANVFGAPWYVVDGEGFWGQDRLDFVERALT